MTSAIQSAPFDVEQFTYPDPDLGVIIFDDSAPQPLTTIEPGSLFGLRINEIQGSGLRSPFEGQQVLALPGIVTAVANNGFYLQNPRPDQDSATSEGIFVFTGSPRDGQSLPKVGDAVLATGRVTEFQPGGTTNNNLTITQISSNFSDFSIASTGNSLPELVVIGADGRTPPTEVISPNGILFYESLEGMRVKVQDAVAVSPTRNFSANSEIWTVANRGTNATGMNSRGGITISQTDFNPERIQIDDGLLRTLFQDPRNGNPLAPIPQVNVGFSLGDVIGVVSYDRSGNYEILATEPVRATSGQLQREVTHLKGTADQLTIASYNVENLNPFAGVRFETLASQIVNNLKSPDIIALQEIQDNNGPINDGTVAADITYQFLIHAIAQAGGPTYRFVNLDPVDGRDGGQPGGNIRVGYLYNPDRVSLKPDSVRRITDPSATPDDDGAFAASRKPLVATFEFNGHDVTIINNHLTARSSSSPLFGDLQPQFINRDDQRRAQAQVLNSEVNQILAGDPNAHVVVLGDLNGFDFEKFQQILGGEVLTNLTQTLPVEERYTFIFQGNSQALDHIFVTNKLASEAKYDIVHVNVDFAEQPADHEPLITALNLPKQTGGEGGEFVLQILHASDGEAGVLAFSDIPGFSAVMNALYGRYPNALKLNTGDLFISGPFFNASRDIYDNARTGNPVDVGGIADILINNELGWDVASIGNHEFSGGFNNFLQLVATNNNWVNGINGGVGIESGVYPGTTFPYLANNLDFSGVSNLPSGLQVVSNGGPPLPNTLTGSVVVDINGEKVGLIGIVTPYLRNIADIGSIRVTTRDADGNEITNTTPPEEQAASIIANITPELQSFTNAGINKIFLMAHLQESIIEQVLAQKIAALGLPVDILFGGGSHRLMTTATGVPPLREDETQQLTNQLLQPFPQVFTSGENKVIYVNSAAYYRYLNQIVVTFDQNGVITNIGDNSGPFATDIAGVDRLYDKEITTLDQVRAKADPEIIQILDGVRNFVNVQDGNIFGQTDVFLNGLRGDVRTQETNLGNLSADSQIFYGNAYLQQFNLLPGFDRIDISFRNGGGIRDVIGVSVIDTLTGGLVQSPPQANPEVGKEKGDISQLDVSNSLRFNNELVVGTVNAAGLYELAEHMVSAAEDISGRFGQIGGFRFSFDPTAQSRTETRPGQRIQNLAVVNDDGSIRDIVVQNGQLVGDPNRTFSVVTSRNLALGIIDNYPAVIQNIVSLLDFPEPDALSRANLASGREQDALAELLAGVYNRENGQIPFAEADTPQAGDERIQNLAFRQDTVLAPTTTVGDANDVVNGRASDDLIRGLAGADFLRGGSGNDVLIGGTGNDILTGDAGADLFVLAAGDGTDTILDFSFRQGDRIGLSSISFDQLTLTQGAGSLAVDTLVTLTATNEVLAVLTGVQPNTLSQATFSTLNT